MPRGLALGIIYIAKNGTILTSTRVLYEFGGGQTPGYITVPISGTIELASNDYIEVFVTNYTNSTNITANNMYLQIR
ncbi:hypothetical protein [Lutibacter sp.]|uniref:hypothetical protein n=1 Tax=Lutibacter sp. TaxID=1925666 RepID=UPI0027325B42|nr:hypothetical protein [Lutibacter sp.]MDP3312780.1 hypothetical protein [Lutibacter sp.]